MSEPCPTPGQTPTVNAPTTGRIGRFLAYLKKTQAVFTPIVKLAEFARNLVRQDMPEDPKRLVTMMSAAGLIAGWLKIVWSASKVIESGKDILSGTAMTLGSLALMIATLAGYVHHKPDDPLPGDQR